MIMALWPSGWRLPGFPATAAAGWHPAINSVTSGFKTRMPSRFARKGASAVVQRYRPAAALKPVVPANGSGYRYRVDMGRELQGLLTSCDSHNVVVSLRATGGCPPGDPIPQRCP